MRLEGRVALITGASRGIGAGIARCMAREGASIVVNYVRSEEGALSTVGDVEALGAKAIAVKADISNRQQVESMIEQSLDAFGKVDILVNNAGNEGPTTAMIDTTPEDFLETFHIHFMGAYYCIYSLLPHMRRYDRGDIQLISSRQADYCPPQLRALQRVQGRPGYVVQNPGQGGEVQRHKGQLYSPRLRRDGYVQGCYSIDDRAARYTRGRQENATG